MNKTDKTIKMTVNIKCNGLKSIDIEKGIVAKLFHQSVYVSEEHVAIISWTNLNLTTVFNIFTEEKDYTQYQD